MAKIAFIGGGNMSTCIFQGIKNNQNRDVQDEIIVSGPHLEKLAHFKEQGASITSNNIEAVNNAEVIFLGVKPQVLLDVIAEFNEHNINFKDKLIISMLAGWRMESLKKYFKDAHIIRIMPNTPSQLGLGVVSIYCDHEVKEEEKDLCLDLLFNLGALVLTNEEGINNLGAIAGSGPAFVYRFMEAFTQEAINSGFDEKQARTIVEQLFLGASQMVINQHKKPISQLREEVTSKGGTTFQGLQKMNEYKFEEMLSEMIKACLKRTHEFEDMYK